MHLVENDKNTIHIALATYPQNQSNNYVEDIKHYFAGFKKRITNNFVDKTSYNYPENLYTPLVYHIFGTYDVAFISIIDSFKFAQKIFVPKPEDCKNSKEGYNPNSYQILTGITVKREKELMHMYNDLKDKNFLGIINLKLNDGLYIGNGEDYKDAVINLIYERFNDCGSDFIIVQSFSWFEISILYFQDDSEKVASLITKIRTFTLNELGDNEQFLNRSLYNLIDEDLSTQNPNLFSDSNSFFGIHYDKFTKGDLNDLELCTSIDIQINPGHLEDTLKTLNNLKLFDEKNIKFVFGKTDYKLEFLNNKIGNNHQFYLALRDDTKSLVKSVKRIKTIPKFISLENSSKHPQTFIDLTIVLQKLGYCTFCLDAIEDMLIHLKISRQIREKIIKIYFNYNVGILDKILFTYYLDFTPFLRNFTIRIISDFLTFQHQFLSENDFKQKIIDLKLKNAKHISCKWEKLFNEAQENYLTNISISKITQLDEIYVETIKAFEEGYHLRFLNGYVFEEMFDMDIDFNSSIHQLLTSFNTFASIIGNFYFPGYFTGGHLVQLHLKNTVSNNVSINYNVHHLTAPEFVFFTIEKEVLNSYLINNANSRKLYLFKNDNFLEETLKTLNNDVLNKLAFQNVINIKYLFIDYQRYLNTCKGDIGLWTYWFWTYNLQDSSFYSTNGSLAAEYFNNELFRQVLLITLIDENEVDNIQCPIPELYHLWQKNIASFKKIALLLIQKLDANTIKKEWEIGINHTRVVSLNPQFKDMVSNKINLKEVDEEPLIENVKNQKRVNILIQENKIANLTFNRNESFYYKYMYSYLTYIYEKNGKKVRLLRRNWATGKPIGAFTEKDRDEEFLYYTEQFGGTFHPKAEKLNEYFNLKNSILQSIFHISAVAKKELISTYIS